MMKFNILDSLQPVNEETVKAWEREEKERAIAEKLASNIPVGYENESFDTFIAETTAEKNFLNTVKKVSNDIVNGKTVSLVLSGTCGIGKTHLASAAMRDVMTNGENHRINTYTDIYGNKQIEEFVYGMSAKYCLVPHLLERYVCAKSFNSKETQADIIKEVTDANLIVLDEVGRGLNERDESDVLYRVINECWINKISIIIITNHEKNKLAQLLGRASVDRLKPTLVSINLDGIESKRKMVEW